MVDLATRFTRACCLLGVAWLGLQLLASAAEKNAADKIVIGFVDTPRTADHVVRLSDLIQVLGGHNASLDALLELPLGPAPRENVDQVWHASDVLQHLELRGLHPDNVRWSGATQTKLQRIAQTPGLELGSIEPAFVQSRTLELARNLVSQAIKEYLDLKTGAQTDWVISVEVPAKLADIIRIRRNIIGIGGGQDPWLGKQEFVLQVKDRDVVINVPIPAHIDLPPMVLVARRPLRRDEIITAEALDLAPLPSRAGEAQSKYYTNSAELIGQQLKRSVSTGLPISADFVGAPVVISRNEMIEVESISGSVSVRTMARSLASGAVGDLIDIETIPAKQRMLATVVGPMKVRVAAVSARGGLNK